MSERVKVVEIEYPRNPGAEFDTVEVGLLDVRAADSIRVSYDFERDGWSIQQARYTKDDMGYIERVGWEEVSFHKAWALEPDAE